jgi:hypothetical protein
LPVIGLADAISNSYPNPSDFGSSTGFYLVYNF